MTRRLMIIAAVMVALLVARAAGACSCLSVHPLDLFEKTLVVFSGVVENVIEHPRDTDLGRLSGKTEYVFHTVQVWKGPLRKTFNVVSERSSGGCGYRFLPGQHYLVYADVIWETDILETNQCLRPQLVARALWDRAVLREPFVVDAELALPRPTEAELRLLTNVDDRQLAYSARCALGLETVRRRQGAE